MSAFTAAQRAELGDAMARSRVEAHEEHMRHARQAQDARAGERAKTRPKRRREVLPPKTSELRPPTSAESDLADRLLPHLCRESVIDRDRHALCVARTILELRRRAAKGA